jgi:hypothetical protein
LLTTAGAAVLVVGSIAAVGGTGVAGAATGQPSATTGQTQTQTQTQNLRYLGSVNLRQLAISHAPAAGAGTKIAGPTEIRREPEREGGRGATPPPVRPAPNAANTPVSQGSGGTSSFVGVTGLLQRQADNGNQFSLEPPDQGLCAGGGFIVETVNLAFAVYTDAGQQSTGRRTHPRSASSPPTRAAITTRRRSGGSTPCSRSAKTRSPVISGRRVRSSSR